MLKFFPTPYPDEWWYSVLCRYHVRSGNQSSALTLRKLYKYNPPIQSSLIPNNSCYILINQTPQHTFDLKKIIFEHTLFPFYTRFLTENFKQKYLSNVLSGYVIAINKSQFLIPNGCAELKYCPVCYKEDKKTYGEPYWHREHQIPLMLLCLKHKCLLHSASLSSKTEFLPLYGILNKENDASLDSIPTWEPFLSEMLYSFLTLPFDADLLYLSYSLKNIFTSRKFRPFLTKANGELDNEKLRLYCIEFYGTDIGMKYFSTLKHFKFTSPEKYALLAVIADLTTNDLMHLKQNSPKNQNKTRTHIIIYLSTEEKNCIADAASKLKYKRVSAFSKAILMEEVDRILSNELS